MSILIVTSETMLKNMVYRLFVITFQFALHLWFERHPLCLISSICNKPRKLDIYRVICLTLEKDKEDDCNAGLIMLNLKTKKKNKEN